MNEKRKKKTNREIPGIKTVYERFVRADSGRNDIDISGNINPLLYGVYAVYGVKRGN